MCYKSKAMANKSHEEVGCKLSKFGVTSQIISKSNTSLFLKYITCAFIVIHYMVSEALFYLSVCPNRQ